MVQNIGLLLDFISSLYFILGLLIIVVIFQILVFHIKDKKKIKALKQKKEPKEVNIEDLKNLPLVNTVVPAWKEGKEFEDCLESLVNLKYPKRKVIVNAGGSQETINIAEKFRKYDNFIIIRQEGGTTKASLGKIRALNQCFEYLTEGIIHFTDADVIVTDEILLKMIRPIVNLDEKITAGGYRPKNFEKSTDLEKYLYFSAMGSSKYIAKQYIDRITGSNTWFSIEAVKQIGKFTEDQNIAEDISRFMDIRESGLKVYSVSDFGSRIYTDLPRTIAELYEQKKRYLENSLFYSIKYRKVNYFLKFTALIFLSFYLVIFPIFLLFNFGLFIIGIIAFFSIYLSRIRRYLFFTKTVEKKYYSSIKKSLFLKMIGYIYIEMIINIRTAFGLIKFYKSMKKIKKGT